MKKSQSGRGFSRRDAGEWADLLAAQAQSGQSVKTFCAARGISAASYYRWQKLLQEERQPIFHPIEIATQGPTGGVMVELPGGVRLHLSELPPAAYLRSLSWGFNDEGR